MRHLGEFVVGGDFLKKWNNYYDFVDKYIEYFISQIFDWFQNISTFLDRKYHNY